jgi:hypothetical protein
VAHGEKGKWKAENVRREAEGERQSNRESEKRGNGEIGYRLKGKADRDWR